MNVIVKEAEKFNVGDSIICLLESQTITTKIIKKQENNLYLYISWNEFQRLKDRRRAVRLPLHTDAQIVLHSNQLKATILDISIHGIGFEYTDLLRSNEMFKMIFTLRRRSESFYGDAVRICSKFQKDIVWVVYLWMLQKRTYFILEDIF